MENKEKSIGDIINRIKNGEAEKNTDAKESLEFETTGSSFVFEFAADEKPKEEQDEQKSQDVAKNEAKDEPLMDAESSTQDVFSVAESSEENDSIDTPQTIFKAYVPRFTEASEHYRMINDPRPRYKSPKPVEETSKITGTDSAAPVESVDPTAELDENVSDAVIVNMSTEVIEEDTDSLNVFKFSEENGKEENRRERTVEDERADIHRLFEKESETDEEATEKVEQIKEEPLPEQEPKSYTIPDPDSGMKVVDFDEEEKRESISPDGVSEYVPDKGRRLGQEFELPIQRDSIKDRFLDAIMAVKIRIGAACFFAVALLFFELASFYDLFDHEGIALYTFSGFNAVVDLLLCACAFLVALPESLKAIKALGKKRLSTYMILPISFLVICAYTALVSAIGVYTYPLFGFIFSLFAVFSISATLCKIRADFTAFKVISKNGEKQILEKKLTRMLPEENYALDGLVDEYKSRTARIFRAAFITDFFKRSSAPSEKSSHAGLLLSISVAISLICSLICYFVSLGALAAVSAFTFVFLMGVPAIAVLSHKLSFRDAEKNAEGEESAALGENSLYEFSEVDVICFEDTEIFGIDDVNLKRFMLYGDRDNIENVMRQMCSLFSVVGGPLNTIFVNALDNRVRHNPAKNTVIENDGLSGEVSGKKISAGSEEYMLRHGIAIPEGATVSERKNDTTKIMYAAEGNEVYAKFYIRYSFSEEFTMLLPALKEQGVVPLIYTSDPNLSNELLRRLTAGSDCMRVMKRLTPGTTDDKLHNRVSSGIVTVGDKINAINLVLLSKKYKRFSERLRISELVSMGIGLGFAVILSFVGLPNAPMAFFAVWQLLWLLFLRFSSKNMFLKKNGDRDGEGGN